MPGTVPPADAERIRRQIESADSPVGIDAATTHVLIIWKLEQIERRLDELEAARRSGRADSVD